MTQESTTHPPRLSRLQEAWLREIGLDRRMLAHHVAPADEPAAPEPAPAARAMPAVRRPERAEPMPAHGGLQSARELLSKQPARKQAEAETSVLARPRQPVPQAWEDLAAHIEQCQACGLHRARSHAVSGTGAEQAPEWMVVGEAPGSVDDRTGLPFQGKAGLLLQAMLASIQVTGQTPVFFTNLIKCRPLGNRTPTPDEIAACLPYLQRQIALLRPQRILALGGLAAQAMLGRSEDLEDLRGKVHTLRSETGQDIPVVVTYHPAALLLRPQHKPDAWRDLSLARGVGVAGGSGLSL